MKNMLSSVKLVCLAALILLLNQSCKKSKEDINPGTQILFGKLEGIVHTPNNYTVVPGAVVASGSYSTITDHNGHFSISIPEGSRTLTIQTGKGKIFYSSLSVKVIADQTQTLADSLTVLKQRGILAYITGAFDQIQTIVIDSLGYSATQLTVTDLASPTALNNVNGLFLNCGKSGSLDSAKYLNLSNYVDNGGSIYSSDFAVEYITGDGNWFNSNGHGIQKMGSVKNNFKVSATCISPMIGGFMADSLLCTEKMGPSGMIPNVQILDSALIQFLNKSTTDINYDLGGWEVVHSYDAPFYPVMTDVGMGALALATPISNGSGRIFFTTFHNNPQGVISQDVKHILEYFILNL